MARHAAFLRGINLGPRRRVSMPELRERLDRAGYGPVATLAQSGNVALTSDTAPGELEGELGVRLRDWLGFDVAVLVRTREELAAVVARDPFAREAEDPRRYQVSFLSSAPEPERVAELEQAAVAPERVVVVGREIYAWHPGGVGRSELAKLITERRLGVEVTARNWRTVAGMLDLTDALGE